MNGSVSCKIKNPKKPNPKLPPPLVYILMIGAGLVIDYFYPLAIFKGQTGIWVGSPIIICGIILHGYSIVSLKKAETTIHAHKAASVLVESGPFGYSRNPIYIAMGIMHSGISLLFNNAWSLVSVVPALFIVHFAVVKPEEIHLRHQFGDVYENYTRNVRRWI